MANKKKPALSPEAARILEQYRKAGQKAAVNDADPSADGSSGSIAKPSAPPPLAVHRSGTRGK